VNETLTEVLMTPTQEQLDSAAVPESLIEKRLQAAQPKPTPEQVEEAFRKAAQKMTDTATFYERLKNGWSPKPPEPEPPRPNPRASLSWT
jgi:hypothetical protein